MSLAGRLAASLQAQWWQRPPGILSLALWPLSCLYRVMSALDRWLWSSGVRQRVRLPVPVLVVGNLIVGGAGKTPTVMALIQELQSKGWRPGVVSRGYGRAGTETIAVEPDTPASACGDEPLLIRLRSGAPVMVGRNRTQAAQRLLAAHAELDLIIADDGLQHHRLARDFQVIVFDARGVGNGWLLPAGPLRQRMPEQTPANTLVLYNAAEPSTPLPGGFAQRRLGGAVALADWWLGVPAEPSRLDLLATESRIQPLLAAAGLAEPERFFAMLEARGLRIERLPLPDHCSYSPLPWPDVGRAVLVTEKDAVKLKPGQTAGRQVWVVTLDFRLPEGFDQPLRQAIENVRAAHRSVT